MSQGKMSIADAFAKLTGRDDLTIFDIWILSGHKSEGSAKPKTFTQWAETCGVNVLVPSYDLGNTTYREQLTGEGGTTRQTRNCGIFLKPSG